MAVVSLTLPLNSRGNSDVVDITDEIELLIEQSELSNGIACSFVQLVGE
jgi:thiamine phosphate synthase YjbQ (UPF0047 family)